MEDVVANIWELLAVLGTLLSAVLVPVMYMLHVTGKQMSKSIDTLRTDMKDDQAGLAKQIDKVDSKVDANTDAVNRVRETLAHFEAYEAIKSLRLQDGISRESDASERRQVDA